MSGDVRAQYLGSAGRTALVRCGHCGRRNYFDRRRWEWFEVAVCSGCWRGIVYRGLLVVTYREAEALALESTIYEGELRALRLVEGVMRRFLQIYETQPYWMWSPQTRRMVGELGQALRPVEAARARRAAGDHSVPGLAAGIEAGGAPTAPNPSHDAGDVRELSPEESRALDYFAAVTPDQRRVVLAMLEDMSRWDKDNGDEAEPADPDAAEMRRALERLEAEGGVPTPPRPDPAPIAGPSPAIQD